MTETKVIETHIVATAQPQSDVVTTAQTVKPKSQYDIRAVVNEWALEDQLPFDPLEYDAEVFENRPTVTVGSFVIPLVNSLTSSEDWYFRKLEASKMEGLIGARGEFGQLNQLAKKQLGLSEDQTIWDVITGGQGGLLKFSDGREGEFIQAHREEITRFMRSWMALSNETGTRIAKIWFFLVSRCGGDIEPGKIAKKMLMAEQEAILALITKEANNGKDPDNEPPEDAPRDDGGGGKALATPNEAPSGETSIGNLTQVHTSETNGLVPDVLELNLVG